MQYLNLIGEMAKRKVKNESIAQELGIHRNSVYNKLNGESSFSVDEAIRIRDTFFPGYDIKYLFQTDEKEVENSVKEKPTLNDIRKKNGLDPIPDGDVILTKV